MNDGSLQLHPEAQRLTKENSLLCEELVRQKSHQSGRR